MKRLLNILALFIFLVAPLSAQKQYRFHPLEEGGGVHNSRCVSVLQSEDGYMWFATHSGIDRFNGTDMVNYSLQAPNSSSDNDNIINIAIKSKHHSILCGSKSGSLYSYNLQLDHFELILDKAKSDFLFNIIALYEDDAGNIWIGNSSGLLLFDNTTKELQEIDVEMEGINTILRKDNTSIWLATNDGLCTYDFKTQKMQNIAFKGEKITAMHLDGENDLLVGMDNSHLARLLIIDDNVEVRSNKKIGGEDENPIKCIVKTPEGQLAIAIDGKGVFVLDNALAQIAHYSFDKDDKWSIASNGVYDIFYAKDNTLWVATWGGGVSFSDPNQKPFEIVQHTPYINNSLSNNAVSSILQVDDMVWYGTKEGISIYNEKSDQWRHLPSHKDNAFSEFIALAMCHDKQGNIWVATYGKGLLKYSNSGNKIDIYNKARKDKFSTESDHLYSVLEDEKGAIWSAGIWGSLTIFDFKNDIKKTVNLTNIRILYETKSDIFVGTLFGLFIVDKKTYQVRRTSHEKLNSTRIITITKHPEKDIYYFGTDAHGLLIWDRNTDTLNKLTETNGLSSNFIRSTLWGATGELWVATTGGLTHLFTETLESESYLQEDGLAFSEFSENAAMLHLDGQAYFGGPNGVTIFTPSKITKSDKKTKTILTGIKVLGDVQKINEEGPLYKNINLQNGIILPYQKNSFTIEFGAIAYTNPHKVQYKWRLLGLNDLWLGESSVKEASYTKVPPGRYTFQLMSSNEDGVWYTDDIKSFNVHILKPLWLTVWAWLFYLIIIGSIFYLLLKYYKTLLHDQHSMEKQQFFISIAHDLRTPLSLIKVPVEKMVEKSETLDDNRKSLIKVKRNVDRLTNLVNQLLDFQKSDLKKMVLRPERINLALFIDERVQAFEPLSHEKNIELKTSLEETTQAIYLDKDKMEKIMYNLLSNAFKYTPQGGTVKVKLEYTKKYCIICVSDTGEGIPHNQQSNIFKRYYRASNAINSSEVGSGVGLMLTKQLVEMQEGNIKFDSLFGKGSTFIVTLPLISKELSYEEGILAVSEEQRITTTLPEKQIEKVASEQLNRILVVEDNPELRQTLVEELSEDYQVIEAADGVEGVKMAKHYLPRIIVSDVMMPNKSGHALCTELKESLETCHIPIILLTALDSPEYKREGLEYGADAYMEKPFEVKMLRTQIKNLIRSREVLKKKYLLPSSNSSIEYEAPTNPNEELIEKVKEYVLNNLLDSKLSVETAAREVGLSRPVLYRKIKSLTDLSPQQFLLTIRLNEAARTLKKGNKNVSEAAYDTGFSDPKYFSQIFKKHFGMTPSQYVKEG